VSARLIAKFGARTVLIAGLAMLLGALALLLRMPTHAHYVPDLLPTMLLIAGGGLAMPATAGLGMSGARAQDAGLVSGLYNTTAQVGAAIGAAVLSTLAAGRTANLLRSGHSPAVALSGGYHVAFAIGVGLLVAALLIAVVALRGTDSGSQDDSALDPSLAPDRDLVPAL